METQTSLSTDIPEKKKPGPKPKADPVAQLQIRVHNLEQLIIRMAHNSGTAHAVLIKAGLEPYEPTAGDMNKFIDAAVTG